MNLGKSRCPSKELPLRYKFSRGMYMPSVTPLAASKTPMPKVPTLNLSGSPLGSARRTTRVMTLSGGGGGSASPVPTAPAGQTPPTSVRSSEVTPRGTSKTPRIRRGVAALTQQQLPKQRGGQDYVDKMVGHLCREQQEGDGGCEEEMRAALETYNGGASSYLPDDPETTVVHHENDDDEEEECLPKLGDRSSSEGGSPRSSPSVTPTLTSVPPSSTMVWLEETAKRVAVRREEAQRRHLRIMRRIDRLGELALRSTHVLADEEDEEKEEGEVVVYDHHEQRNDAAQRAHAEDEEFDEALASSTIINSTRSGQGHKDELLLSPVLKRKGTLALLDPQEKQGLKRKATLALLDPQEKEGLKRKGTLALLDPEKEVSPVLKRKGTLALLDPEVSPVLKHRSTSDASVCSSNPELTRQNTLALMNKAQGAGGSKTSSTREVVSSWKGKATSSPPFHSATHHQNSLAEESAILRSLGESGLFSSPDQSEFSSPLSGSLHEDHKDHRRSSTVGGGGIIGRPPQAGGRAPSLDKADLSPPSGLPRRRGFEL